MRRGVVITGIGVLSPAASGRDAYWNALQQGRPAFGPITLFDAAPYGGCIAGELRGFDPLPILGKKGLRDLDRSTRLLCAAARLALDDSRLEITPENSPSFGAAIGATFGSLHSIAQFDLSGLIEGPRAVNPSHFPNTVINSPASQVSIRFALRGFNTTVSTGFCASLDAISYAADFIMLNRAAAVAAGGVEELCEETFRGFFRLGALSGSDGTEARCRPFDRRRSGTILAEGSAVLMLEGEDHAKARNAPMLGRILGTGNSFDPAVKECFRSSGRGLARAITQALHQASLRPGEIDCICASANGTTGLDCLEAAAMKEVFGDRPVPVAAVKSIIGETYSASGALAVAAAAGICAAGTIPATVGFVSHDRGSDLDFVQAAALPSEARNVLVTAADPNGQNAAVIVGR